MSASQWKTNVITNNAHYVSRIVIAYSMKCAKTWLHQYVLMGTHCRYSKVLIDRNFSKTPYATSTNKDERRRTILESESSRASSSQNLGEAVRTTPRVEERSAQTLELNTAEREQMELYKQKLERADNSEEDIGNTKPIRFISHVDMTLNYLV